MIYDENYPPGVSGTEPEIYGTGDAPDYNYDDAVSWIDSDDSIQADFAVFVGENFQDVVDLFKYQLHPEQILRWPHDPDMLGECWDLFDTFLWTVLDEGRRRIIVRSFVEANWRKYEEWAS
jgi:hypothetical protein